MPYTRDEAQEFTRKATTPAARRQWEHIAQHYLAKGSTEAQAIRAANSVVARKSRSSKI